MINSSFITLLKEKLGTLVLSESAQRIAYSYDNSRYQEIPDVVVLANNAEQIKILVQLCRHYKIPLTVRGRGTNTTGAAVPINGGVLLSLEQMHRLMNIELANRAITVEAGMLNQTVQDEAKKTWFFLGARSYKR